MLIGINGGYFPAICRVCFLFPCNDLFYEEGVLLFVTGSDTRFETNSVEVPVGLLLLPEHIGAEFPTPQAERVSIISFDLLVTCPVLWSYDA